MWSDLFRGPAWIIILVIVLLLFGAPRLPALAKSIGQSMKIFRNEVKTAPGGEAADEESARTITAAPEKTAPEKTAKTSASKSAASKSSATKSASKPPKPKP